MYAPSVQLVTFQIQQVKKHTKSTIQQGLNNLHRLKQFEHIRLDYLTRTLINNLILYYVEYVITVPDQTKQQTIDFIQIHFSLH